MSRIHLLSTAGIICILALFMFVNNCNSQASNTYEFNPASLSAVQTISDGLKNFSLNFLLYTIKTLPESNVVVSPFSVWAMFTVMSEGSSGRTLQQLNKRLRIPRDRSVLRRGFGEIARAFLVNTTTVKLETVNTIFVDNSVVLKEDFKNVARFDYLTDLDSVNFRDPQTVNRINNRVSEATRGKIRQIISADDARNAQILITNAIYFKGQWSMPFNRSETTRQPFYDSHNRVIGNVNMMHLKGEVPYSNLRQFQAYAVKLPYGEQNRLAMYVLLPYFNISLSTMAHKFEKIKATELFKAIADAAELYGDEAVDVYLPRFSITLDLVLNKILNDLGIYDIFDPITANLSLMTENRDLYLSKAIHKATIDVNEEGTEASALTAGTLSNRNTPPKFTANKPFMYFIVEESTNIIVFGGSYSKPEVV